MMHERLSATEGRPILAASAFPAASDLGTRGKWNITSDEIVSRMRSGKYVRWNMVPMLEILGVLQKASQEVQIPVSMLSVTEFSQPLEILDRRSLKGLYSFATYHKERGKKGIIPFLFELAGVSATAEDVIVAMKKNRVIQWDPLPREVIKTLLEKVAQEFGKTVNALLAGDFEKPCVALDGRSLASVYQHFARHPDRKGKPIMIFLLENCGIEVTVYDKLRGRGQFLSKVSPDEIRELLIEAGKELEKPPSMLTSADLNNHFRFLNGQTLNVRARNADGKETSVSLRKNVNIEVTFDDVVEIAKKGNHILWRRIPFQVIREILVKAADEIGIPVSSILEQDMKKHRFNFLGGRSLGGLDTLISSLEGVPSRGKTSYFLGQLGIRVSAGDVIAKIKGERKYVMWEGISWQEIRTILDFAAEEMGIPAGMINPGSFLKKFTFLDGNTLERLCLWGFRHPEKTPEETTLMFIRRKTGISEINISRISRSAFRFSMMKESFVSQNLSEGFKAEDLIPWMKPIAELYESPFLSIKKEEIESESVIFILEQFAKGFSEDDLVKNLHEHLEGLRKKESQIRYKEKLLSTPIGDGNSTLQDVIASKGQGVELEEGELNEGLRESLKALTPLQQKLVIAIAVDGKDLDELTEELGLDMDTLEEHYADALIFLRNRMELEEEE